jgi:hypothetical protein
MTACSSGDVAESFLPVVLPMQAAPAQAIATHGAVDTAALDVTTTRTSGGEGHAGWCSSAKAKVTTVDEVVVREAEIRTDRDGVRVRHRMPALETEQVCAMRWGVASVEELCGGALVECVREGGTHDLDLPEDTVTKVKVSANTGMSEGSGGKWLSRVQGRVAMRDGVPQTRTEGGTGCCERSGEQKVKLREGTKGQVCLGNGVVAMCRPCKERVAVQQT